MGFFDQLGKTISHGVDRAKFEAEKFQKTSRLQGNVGNIKQQLDGKMIELGQRAYDLYRAGQITAPSVAKLAQEIDKLRAEMIVKEEELKAAQAEMFVEPVLPTISTAQSIPISQDAPQQENNAIPAPSPAAQSSLSPEHTKTCPNCQFQMPTRAVFCPNCGLRVEQ